MRQALVRKGYQYIESNFYWKGGEIDLVFLDRLGVLVFVEVRSAAVASPWLRYTITSGKQRRLVNTAHRYRLAREWAVLRPFRFDLAWVEAERVEHWKNVLLT